MISAHVRHSARAFAGEIIGGNGTDEIRKRWIPPTTRGEAVVALALTEPGAGSDAAHLACRAEREGDDYVLTGEKSGISLGMAAHAAIVFARTGSGPGRGESAPSWSRSTGLASRAVACATSAPTSSAARCSRSTTCASRPRTGWAPRARGSVRSCRASTSIACSSALGLSRRGPGLARGDHGLRQGTAGLRARAGALRGRVVPDRGSGHTVGGGTLALLSRAVAGRPRRHPTRRSRPW